MEISSFPWLRVRDRHTFDVREGMRELGKQCKANKLNHMTKSGSMGMARKSARGN
jgi:hypothetical protein